MIFVIGWYVYVLLVKEGILFFEMDKGNIQLYDNLEGYKIKNLRQMQ